jgi:hypothetical protein
MKEWNRNEGGKDEREGKGRRKDRQTEKER